MAILHFVSRKQGHQGVILGIVGTVLYVVVLAIGIVLRLSKSYLGGL